MFDIRHETALDAPAREALLDRCFGPGRAAKTCERLREGRLPADGLALSAVRGAGWRESLVGTIRLWNVAAGPGRPALMLGPVAVDPAVQGAGLGGRLIRDALSRAAASGHGAVILVGDEPFYRGFGFGRAAVAGLLMPGWVDPARFLGLELVPGALAGASGLVTATGRPVDVPNVLPAAAAAAAGFQPTLRAA